MVRRKIVKLRRVSIKPKRIINGHIGGVKRMDRVVSTRTLFTSHGNYATMTTNERKNYIDNLSKEFIVSARDLLESLKDK